MTADLDRQRAALEAYCAAKGRQCLRDPGSGYRKKGLQKVLEMILRRRAADVDAQGPAGSELVFGLRQSQGVEVVIIDAGEQPGFEEELAKVAKAGCARSCASQARYRRSRCRAAQVGGLLR